MHPVLSINQIAQVLDTKLLLVRRIFDLARQMNLHLYLVGGTVRDLILGQTPHDLDFAVDGDGLHVARNLADDLGGAYVALDRDRRTGRVILSAGAAPTGTYLDVASLRGLSLEQDLADRDFTVNAIAMRLEGRQWTLVDPTGGLADMAAQILRATNPHAFERDPIRTLRAIRLSTQLGYKIEPATRQALQAAAPMIAQVAPERVRNEWFKMLAIDGTTAALLDAHELGLLARIAPRLAAFDASNALPDAGTDGLLDAFETVRATEQIWAALANTAYETELPLPSSLRSLTPHLVRRYQQPICDERTRLSLLKCAALLHKVGRSGQQTDPGSLGPDNPDLIGARLAEQQARLWRCSNHEVAMLVTTVREHAYPIWLASQPAITRRAIHCYYRQVGEYGVDAAMVALAACRAAQRSHCDKSRWVRQAETVASLISTYYEQRRTIVDPIPLLSGTQLMRAFGLSEGPQIGSLLRQLKEEQAAGQIQTRDQAMEAVHAWLHRPPEESTPPPGPTRHPTAES